MTGTTTYYFDMDGVLANFHEYKDGWKFSGNYNFIRNLKPFEESVKLINTLLENGEKVYISSLARNNEAKKAKIDWLSEYVPALDEEHIIILVGNAKKHENMKTENGILIDDKLANIRAWRKAGMKALYVENKGEIHMEEIA